MNASDTQGVVFDSATATLLARVVGWDGTAVTQTSLSSIVYSIFLLDDSDPDARTDVDGHTDVELRIADVICDSLQTDDLWTVDATGYNFRHTIDISENPAFAAAGRRYLVEYTLTPTSGQIVLVRFRVNVI